MKKTKLLFGLFTVTLFMLYSCSKNKETPWACGDTITDIDGNVYTTVSIGNQCWMKENLKTVSTIGDNRCYDSSEANCAIYGRLYDWEAAMNVTLPTGWHLPTDEEWTILSNYLGGDSIAGGKMKEVGFDHWGSPNTGATNESGFTGLPGGTVRETSPFNNLGASGFFWSSTEDSINPSAAWRRKLLSGYIDLNRFNSAKTNAMSVRCIKD